MPTENACPRCGSPLIQRSEFSDDCELYECDTEIDPGDGEVIQSNLCLVRELTARLSAAESRLAKLEPLVAFARRHEQWEAKLVMSNEAWQDGAEFPALNKELYDEAMELQAMRNAALAALQEPTDAQ